jgi:hypothetical protein
MRVLNPFNYSYLLRIFLKLFLPQIQSKRLVIARHTYPLQWGHLSQMTQSSKQDLLNLLDLVNLKPKRVISSEAKQSAQVSAVN